MLISVLGPLQVVEGEVVGDGADRTPNGVRQRRLLLALTLARGRTVPTDRLIDVLWGDDLPGKPANALQAQVSQLRRALPEPATVVTDAPGYRLEVAERQVDASRFERLAADGRALAESGDVPSAVDTLVSALSL